MAKKSEDRWPEVAAALSHEQQARLTQLRADYLTAARRLVPNWTGAPSAEILAELIRQGWRK